MKLQHFARFHCRWEWDTFCHVGVVVGFGRSKGTSGPVECTSSSLLKGSHPRKVGGVISGTIVPSGEGEWRGGARNAISGRNLCDLRPASSSLHFWTFPAPWNISDYLQPQNFVAGDIAQSILPGKRSDGSHLVASDCDITRRRAGQSTIVRSNKWIATTVPEMSAPMSV